MDMTEELLRRYRDAALKILTENQNQIREGIDQLVTERLPEILQAAAGKDLNTSAAITLELAHTMFALGYTVAKLGKELPNP